MCILVREFLRLSSGTYTCSVIRIKILVTHRSIVFVNFYLHIFIVNINIIFIESISVYFNFRFFFKGIY